MNITQMHIGLDLRLQKINSNAFNNFLPEEKDNYLNQAINKFIDQRMLPEGNRIQEGFEQSQKRIDDLRTLVVKNDKKETAQVTTEAAVGDFFADRAPLPSDYRHLISFRLRTRYNRNGISFSTDVNGKRVPDGVEGTDYETLLTAGKPVQSDDIYALLTDPLNTTIIKNPLVDQHKDGIDVYTDDTFLVDEVVFNYIKKPATVSKSGTADCDLPEHTHEAIVDLAAKLMASDIDQLGAGQKLERLTDEQ